MNLNAASNLFIIVLVGYLVMAEIFTVLFRLTGLSEEKAKFQVMSLLTNCGFTTEESELITSSRLRRKLARTTMLFGYCFNVTIVSSIVNVFLSLGTAHTMDWIKMVIVVVGLLIVYWIIKREPKVKIWFDTFIKKIASKVMFRKNANPLAILDTYHKRVIAELVITSLPECLRARTLKESCLRERHNLKVLVINRGHEAITDVGADEMLQEGDRVVLFGELKDIRQVFGHPNHIQ